MAKYSYLANGSKTGAENGSGAGLVYRGSLIYKKASNGTLTFDGASIPEGRLLSGATRLYVTDHLGSVKAVVNGNNGNLYEVNNYTVYGKQSANSSASSYLSTAPTGEKFRQHFTGKEDQAPDFTVPFTDFGARQYSPALRRWLVPDPLSEKYYGISPYAYCAGDPVNLVDPQGDTLRFAAGVSDAFRRAFAEAVQYMNASETSYNLAKLHSSSQVYYIDDGTRTGPSFSPSKHTVFWHPKLVFVSDNGVWISPVTQLAHEVKHAVNFDTSYAEYVTRKNLQDADYENEEERYVITTTEQYAARHHGEIDNNEVTRTNHSGNSNNYFVSKEKSLLDIIRSVIENNYRNRTK